MCWIQSVGGEGGGRRLQGARGVGASHVGQEVGVRAQLMDVEAVLLAVRQTPADERLRSKAQCVRQCVCVSVTLTGCSIWGRLRELRYFADAKKVGKTSAP